MTILIIILVLLVLILITALYFQIKSANKQTEDQQQLLKDYQKRVDEQEKLLADYRSLEQNFDNVGQGYEQALLAFDKIEEEKQQLQHTIETLQQQVKTLQDAAPRATSATLQKKQAIEQAVAEVKKALKTASMADAAIWRSLNTILGANEVEAETAIEADDNVTVSDILQQAVRESGIDKTTFLSLTTEVPEEIGSMMLLTNEQAAVRAVSALLDNAQKFTTEGNVKLSADTDGSILTLRVEDTGMGIAAEDAEHIFEPFVKLNNYFDGAGLGLTAARSIARRLGGDLRLDTAYPGPGARFTLTLPL